MSTVADIKAAHSIESVLAANGVEVKGGIACCPFHDDKNPSFSIKDDKWKCFAGCGHGDVIELLAKFDGKTSVEYLRNGNVNVRTEQQDWRGGMNILHVPATDLERKREGLRKINAVHAAAMVDIDEFNAEIEAKTAQNMNVGEMTLLRLSRSIEEMITTIAKLKAEHGITAEDCSPSGSGSV